MVALAFIANGITSRLARLDRQNSTAAALAKAKEALIAYAVTFSETHQDNVPGYLPCPNTGFPEGNSAPTCGAKNVSGIGRLPWRSLSIEPLRDSSGECLWYVVSGTFKNSPQTNLMNWDNNGLLEVVSADGTTLLAGSRPENRAVAAIIAPGPALGGQNRAPVANTPECGGNYIPVNYLDSSAGVNNAILSPAANALSRLISREASVDFNDRVIFITAEEIFESIRRRKDFRPRLERLTRSIAECLGKYGELNGNPTDNTDHRLPWPTLVNLPDFASDNSYNDSATGSPKSGRLPFIVDTSKTATVNGMVGTRLFTIVSPLLCPSWNVNDDAWYTNWKDHFFYYLSGSYTPASLKPTPFPCPSCLSVNGVGNYAAVVLFANDKVTGQSRNSIAEKGIISNYLEGRNSSSHPNTSGATDLEKAGSANDLLYCVEFNQLTHASNVFVCP